MCKLWYDWAVAEVERADTDEYPPRSRHSSTRPEAFGHLEVWWECPLRSSVLLRPSMEVMR